MNRLEVPRYRVSEYEWCVVAELVEDVRARHPEVTGRAFLTQAPLLAQRLPEGVREFMHGTTPTGGDRGLGVIGGHRVEQDRLGPTPSHWRHDACSEEERRHECLLVLYASLLGDVFGWKTQQDGRLIHNVLPIHGHKLEQLGSGSETPLAWHTEDAFHDCRADYLLLYCLRNPQRAATTVTSVDTVRARDQVLFEPRIEIRPDESHLPKNNSGEADHAAVVELMATPHKIAVLYGSLSAPYMRLDPYFMELPDDDPAAGQAFTRLVCQLNDNVQELVLEPGDLAIINNHKVAHGRRPFRAAFDGSDRWLKRANVTVDLRKSAHLRDGAGRLI